MPKSVLVCVMLAAALTACEKQQQDSAEIGALPKQMIDRATDDIAKAHALAAEQRLAAEAEMSSAQAEK